MTEFHKEDIEPLDFIVSEILIKPIVQTDDLIIAGFIKPSNDNGLELNVGYNPTKEFVRYLYILDQYKVCDCYDTADSEFARSNEATLHFKKQGGFKKLYTELEEKKKREKLEFKLAESNIQANKLNKKIAKKNAKNAKFNRDTTIINVILGIANVGLLVWQIFKTK